MSSSNTNWRMGNERRVNLAMTAELALGNGIGNKNISNMQYNPADQANGVPRIRGNPEGNNNTNDILGIYKPSGNGGIGSSSKGFGFSEENKDLSSGYKSSAVSGLPPRGYNPSNEFNNFNSGLTTNNNITNQYKPSGGLGQGFDVLNNFQTSNSNSTIQAESNGFKVQRVRGVQQQTTNTMVNNNQQFGIQTFGNVNGSSNQTGGGLAQAKNNFKKDENSDIDLQTRQLKQEIDSLDLKLGLKNNTSSNNNLYNSDQPNINNNNAFKSSTTNFGSNNNINTAFTGSGKNFYSNNSDSNSNQFNSTSTGTGNSLYGNNGFGISFGQSNSYNNINNSNNNNNFNNFGPLSNNNNSNNLNQNAFNSSGNNFNSVMSSTQQLNNTANNNINNRLPPKGKPPMGPSLTNNFEDTFGVKPENSNQQNEVKKVPVNLESLNSGDKNKTSTTTTATQETKEFSTGTYDPSNILNQNRQGRMRSLGRKDANTHEEKAAQATGNKNLPDQEPQLEQFLCPEGCGRTFNKKALAKHIPVCKKHFQPKKEDSAQEQKKPQVSLPQSKIANDDKKQAKPPKAGGALGKKQNSKEVKQLPDLKDSKESKNEALRKLKEQKKKELLEQKEQEQNQDDGLINEPNDNEYF